MYGMGQVPTILQGAATRERLTPEQIARLDAARIPTVTTVAPGVTTKPPANFSNILPMLIVGAVAAWYLAGGTKRRSLWGYIGLAMLAPSMLLAQAPMPYGLSAYNDMDTWCASTRPFTATYTNSEPKNALKLLQRAHQCKFSIVMSYPRRLYTNGWNNGSGDYSAPKHRAVSDSFAKYLPPDTLRKYVGTRTLLGIITGDDFGCVPCWNGTPIPWTEARDAANYAKSKMPLAPIGVRLDALKMSIVMGWKIDFGWAQWVGTSGNLRRFGTPAKWYAQNDSAAKKLGLAGMFYGLNTTHCTGSNSTPPCTPTQVTQWGTMALNAPKNCGFISWWYLSPPFTGAYKTAWLAVFQKAKQKPFTRCRHPVAGEREDDAPPAG